MINNKEYQPHNQLYWEKRNRKCKNVNCERTKGMSPRQITQASIPHQGHGYCSTCYTKFKRLGKLPAKISAKEQHLKKLIENKSLYESEKVRFSRALKSAKKVIEEFFYDHDMFGRIHYVSSRIKTLKSIEEKQIRRNFIYKNVYQDMEDIAGIKIVCIDAAAVAEARETIERLFKNKILSESHKNISNSGYEALHIILEIFPLIHGSERKTNVEIQIKTIAQDYFAATSHHYIYKIPKKLLPKNWKESIIELSSQLKEIDNKIEALGNEWYDYCIDSQKIGTISAKAIKRVAKQIFKEDLSDKSAFSIFSLFHSLKLTSISEIRKLVTNKDTIKFYEERLETSKISLEEKIMLLAIFAQVGKKQLEELYKKTIAEKANIREATN